VLKYKVMKKIIKIIKWFVLAALAVLILDLAIVLAFANWQPVLKKADAIVVLGAAINSPALQNRSLKALELYEAGMAPLLVLSGGRISDQDISEATYMERVIQKNTAKPLNLILEENSHTTFENLENSKARLPNVESIIIVTDKYHIARAVLTAKRAGFGTVNWSASEPYYHQIGDEIYYYLREVLAMLAYVPKFVLGR